MGAFSKAQEEGGKVFEALVEGEYANPVIVVDEIDKASADAQYDPLGALYSLLEHDTAGSFIDEFAEVAIDASQVIWVATANGVFRFDGHRFVRFSLAVSTPLIEEAIRRMKPWFAARNKGPRD